MRQIVVSAKTAKFETEAFLEIYRDVLSSLSTNSLQQYPFEFIRRKVCVFLIPVTTSLSSLSQSWVIFLFSCDWYLATTTDEAILILGNDR